MNKKKGLICISFLLMAAIPTMANIVTAAMDWQNFKELYGKSYIRPFEEQFRKNVYEENLKKINEHNQAYAKGLKTFTMKINEFGDLTPDEFNSLKNDFLKAESTRRSGIKYVSTSGVIPDSIDWRQKGAVTPVKAQGYCASCWAFSTTGSLEGQHFMKTGQLVSMSEQNLIDCSKRNGNEGCIGGLMDLAFQYIKDNNGIDTEQSYPYEGVDKKCRFKPSDIGGTIKGFVYIPEGNEEALKNAVGSVGPVSVAIDSGHHSFQFYGGGIYNEPKCNASLIDHAALVVGYGSENGLDYWIVKNSWGYSFGDHGYLKVLRNHNNHCGIASYTSYPIV